MAEVTDRIEMAPERRFRPYLEYRDSGVEWLREVPAHWEMKRLKTMASVQLSNVDKHSEEGQIAVKLCNYVDVYYNDLITTEFDFMNATATPEQVRRFRLRVGDVLITKDSESWTDIAVPAVVGEDLPDVLCGYHLAHIRPGPKLDGRFLARQFSAIGTRDQFHVAANGITRFGLGGDAIRTGLFPVAPIDEQHAIADFLDRETAKIDALVARKERLIELLQEKRTALITRAVTRGLDPNVPMKDSGVEWLGEIPAHWGTKKVKRLFGHRKRQGFPELTVLSVYREYGVIKKSSRDDNFNRTPEDLDIYQLVNPGDLVINKMKAWQGSLGISSLSGITSPDYVVYAPDHEANERFLHHFLRCKLLARVYLTMSNGIRPSQWRLEPERFEDLDVLLPPLAEQDHVAAFLDRETAKTDALIAKIGQAINHLNEFRTALISAAVTGKIDVRTASAEATAGQGGTR